MKRELLRWALLFLACYALYTVCVSTGINHGVVHAEERKFIEEKLYYAGCLKPLPSEEETMIALRFSGSTSYAAVERVLYPVIGRELNYLVFGVGDEAKMVLYSDNFACFGLISVVKAGDTLLWGTASRTIWEVDLEPLHVLEPIHKGTITIPKRSERTPAAILHPEAIEPIVRNLLSQFNRPWDEGEYHVTVGWYEDEVEDDLEDEEEGEDGIYADFEIYFEMHNRVGYHMKVIGCSETSTRDMFYNITMVRYRPVDPTEPKPREAWITRRVLRERVKEAAVWEGTFVVGEDGGKYVEGGLK